MIFIAGGVASLSILVVTHAIAGATFGLSFLPRIVVYVAAIFFLPSFVLGMVSPMVVKLALANLEHSGHTVGTIYACSTVGSIVGTFLTGFWLISWLGTRTDRLARRRHAAADRRGHRRIAIGPRRSIAVLASIGLRGRDLWRGRNGSGLAGSIRRRAMSSRTTTASRSSRPPKTGTRRGC